MAIYIDSAILSEDDMGPLFYQPVSTTHPLSGQTIAEFQANSVGLAVSEHEEPIGKVQNEI